MYLDGNVKRMFAKAFLGKTLSFHTEIFEFGEYRILKIGLFRRVKELSKSNQTRYGLSHVYLECKKKIFAIACVGKKLVFHREIFDYFE